MDDIYGIDPRSIEHVFISFVQDTPNLSVTFRKPNGNGTITYRQEAPNGQEAFDRICQSFARYEE
jgi:hypothetical protein